MFIVQNKHKMNTNKMILKQLDDPITKHERKTTPK